MIKKLQEAHRWARFYQQTTFTKNSAKNDWKCQCGTLFDARL